MRFAIAFAAALSACGPGSPGGPNMSGRIQEEQAHPLQSNDIMQRDARANRASVKHILIAWDDLEASYPGDLDPRAAKRSRWEAEELVKQLYERAVAGEVFELLMREYSEDAGSAQSGDVYVVEPGSNHVFEFRRMGLRLDVGEIGKVLSPFGWHIIKRVK